MATRSRTVALVSLLVGSALVMSSACSSSNKKKVLPGEEAGAAGAAGEPGRAGSGGTVGHAGMAGADETAGASDVAGAAGTLLSEGGSAGMENVAGSGATPGEAGSPPVNEAGAAGMAGAPTETALACVPSGSVANFQLNSLNGSLNDSIPVLCRGANLRVGFTGGASDTLTCCGLSDATPAYTLPFDGTSNRDGGGSFDFKVPADAPLGDQIITLTCSDASERFSVSVVDAPVVLSTDSPVTAQSTLTITGTNLANVRFVTLADGEVTRDCPIIDRTDTTIHCTPNYVGSFWVVLTQDYCEVPPFTGVTVTVNINP